MRFINQVKAGRNLSEEIVSEEGCPEGVSKKPAADQTQ